MNEKSSKWFILFLAIAGCVKSPTEEKPKNSYLYSGTLRRSDVVIDKVDTAKCLKTITVFRKPDENFPDDTVRSNTCDLARVFYDKTHAQGHVETVSNDTLEDLERASYSMSGYVRIEWPVPELDSGWVKEFTCDGAAPSDVIWGEKSLRFRASAGTTDDSLELEGFSDPAKICDYLIRFERLDGSL